MCHVLNIGAESVSVPFMEVFEIVLLVVSAAGDEGPVSVGYSASSLEVSFP